MKFLPERKSTRMAGFDYGAGKRYFVTLCSCRRKAVFWKDEKLSSLGELAAEELLRLRRENVTVEVFSVMPDHIHAIIAIETAENTSPTADCRSGTGGSRPSPTLTSVVGLYKSGVTRRAHEMGWSGQLWQRSFYDRIIRDDREYEEVWRYIVSNPQVCREGR